MRHIARSLVDSVPVGSRAALARDLPAIAARSAVVVLGVSVGGQLVQALGGSHAQVAALRTSICVGLLLSLAYVRLGRGRSPLAMLFWPEAAAMILLGAVGGVGVLGSVAAPATQFTVLVCVAIALQGLARPLVSTVYGLVYPVLHRARLVSYGRTVHGIVAVATGWGCGRLFRAHPFAFRYVFPVVALVGLAAIWYFCRMPVAAAHKPTERPRHSAWAVLRRDRMFRRFQLFQLLMGFANLAAFPVIDLYVRRELCLDIDLAVLVVGHGVIMQAIILLTVRWQGRLFDRIGVIRHRVLTTLCLALAQVCWAFADGLPMAVTAAVLAGLGMAGGQIIWLIGSLNFAPRDELATYASIHTFLTGVRGVIAPVFGVWLLSTSLLAGSYRAIFLGAALLMVLSALGHGLLVREPERDTGRSN